MERIRCVARKAMKLTCAVPLRSGASLASMATNSRFRGVSRKCDQSKWHVRVTDPVAKRQWTLGSFVDERMAAMEYDRANLALRGTDAVTNFEPYNYSCQEIEQTLNLIEQKRSAKTASEYNGVYHAGRKWMVKLSVGGIQQYLGIYNDESEAAQVFDAAVRKSNHHRSVKLRLLNVKMRSDYFDEKTWHLEDAPSGRSSRFLGVYFHHQAQKYYAKCLTKHLGCFDSELDAAHAFDLASSEDGGPTNFLPQQYTCQSPASVGSVVDQDGAAAGERVAVLDNIGSGNDEIKNADIILQSNKLFICDLPPEKHMTDVFQRENQKKGVGKRAEQPLVLSYMSSLVQQGHKVGARGYYDIVHGKRVLIARCDLFDHDTCTIYEAKSRVNVKSICMGVGQLLWYRSLEQVGCNFGNIKLTLLLPIQRDHELDRCILQFFADLKEQGISVVFA